MTKVHYVASNQMDTMPRSSKYAVAGDDPSDLKPLKRSGNVAKLAMNPALPSEHFKGLRPAHRLAIGVNGFRPAHCRRKAYPLDRGIVTDRFDVSQWNF
jgi:hypothetical protein